MRLNTAKRYYHIVSFYVILLFLLAFDVLRVGLEEGTLQGVDYWLWPYVLGIYLVFLYRGNPVFVYDSDGEVLIVSSKEPSLAIFSKKHFDKHLEFPKRKLTGYSFKWFPFKRSLELKITSKDGTVKKTRFPISYITRQERKDLERSLRGTLSRNKKEKAI